MQFCQKDAGTSFPLQNIGIHNLLYCCMSLILHWLHVENVLKLNIIYPHQSALEDKIILFWPPDSHWVQTWLWVWCEEVLQTPGCWLLGKGCSLHPSLVPTPLAGSHFSCGHGLPRRLQSWEVLGCLREVWQWELVGATPPTWCNSSWGAKQRPDTALLLLTNWRWYRL